MTDLMAMAADLARRLAEQSQALTKEAEAMIAAERLHDAAQLIGKSYGLQDAAAQVLLMARNM